MQLVGTKKILLVLVQNVDQAPIVVLYDLVSIKEFVSYSSYIVNNLVKIVLVSFSQVSVHGNG